MDLITIVQERYNLLLRYRKILWDYLSESDIQEAWITTRPKSYQWSIDENLRHMLASEIRYIQQPLDEKITQINEGVPAQWVGKVFFRFEERDHVGLSKLKEIFSPVEEKSLELMKKLTQKDLEKITTAPWGEEMSYYNLLETFFAHENYHRGQVHFLITYYRGPPNFENSKS